MKAARFQPYAMGGDIVMVGRRKWLEEAHKGMTKRYDVKTKWIGPGKVDSKSGQVLGRVVTYASEGVKYEADPRHAEIVVEAMNLTDAKPVGAPGWKDEVEEGVPLEGAERTEYRALSARASII